MKKLSIALALLLCLVLCIFCFASCGKKKTESTTAEPGTTPPSSQNTTDSTTGEPTQPQQTTEGQPTEPPHVHTPEANYTVDVEEDCTNPGSKSYHCEECGEIIEGTSVVIPADPAKHKVAEWTVTKEATLFADGAKSGTCSVCNQKIEEVVAETYNEWKYTTDSTDSLSKTKNFGSQILGEDKHFYPTDENPDGLDFHIEFSFLWNEGLLKMSNVGNTKNQVLTGCINNQDAYWMALTTNAKGCDNKVAPGGFEYVACRTVEFGPDGMSEQTATGGSVGNTYADFPNIGGADQANPQWGWHRIAVVAHEELLNEAALKADTTAKATAAEYRFSFTVYVDGVKLYTLSNRADSKFKASTYRPENMLFTAESDGQGGIVYSDISADKNVTWISIPTFQTTEGTAYAVYADEAVFAGNEFAQVVSKVTNPADNVYTTKDGAEIPAKIWYRIDNGEPDIDFDVYTYNPADLDSYTYNSDKGMLLITKTLPDILGEGNHFYPTEENPEGLDLYFEMAILYNETMANYAKDAFLLTLNYQGGNGNNMFYLYTKNNAPSAWCKFSGGFDYGCGKGDNPILVGPAGTEGGTIDTYPNLGEYGWHKIGVRVHQEAALSGDNVVYSGASYLYIDGALVWKVNLNMDKVQTNKNLLFTATNNAGVLTYADNPNANKVRMQLRGEGINDSQAPFYFVFGDVSWKAIDPDWTPDIEPVADPAPAVYKLNDSITVPAAVYFQKAAHAHVWDGNFEVTKAATLLADGEKVEHCSVCGEEHKVAYEFVADVQKFTDSTTGSYNPGIAKLSDIRGEEHFYTAGNDLLAEYSVLWTEEIKDLKTEKDKGPYMDSRFTQTTNPNTTNKNIIYWSLCDNCYGSDCKFAGGFEWGGIDANEPDNPYPKFTDGALGLGETKDEYPNIGGANGGDGTPQGEDRYGWHRVSIRYRQEVANVDAVKAGSAAEYKLSLWVYIDGVLVIHSSATDFIYRPGKSDQKDYKLFTAASDGNGGIAYVENDDLYFSAAYLHYKQMASGKVAYFSIADYSVKIGSEFEQNVTRIDYPIEAQLEVEDGVFVPATMWYTIPCAEHTWDGNFTVVEEATLLNDGLKVEHCSVCGMSHEVATEAAPVITVSNAIAGTKYADNSNKDVAALKNASDIRGDKHFAPTADDEDGNDLWFEYSFLYNETLRNRDYPSQLAEMRLFGFRSISNPSNYRGFYYIYFLNDNDKGPKSGAFNTSNDCPWEGHIDFSTYYPGSNPEENCALDLSSEGNTLNGRPIGRYIAGWGAGRNDAPYLWDSEYQTLGGWHRLGFHYHQEAEIVDGQVRYSGYTELFIDGVKCWKVLTNMEGNLKSGQWKNTDWSLKGKNLLLWTAEIDPEDNTKLIYTENDDVRVGFRIDRLDTSSQPVYVAIDDVQWNCGDGFVHPVVRVEDPKPVKYTVAEGVEVDGAMYFTYQHDHVWDEDYTETKAATLLEAGKKIDHCSICGETRETAVAEEPIVYLTNWDDATRNANPYSIENPDDHKNTFGFVEHVVNVRGDDHFFGGKDLLIEFSFLYNETMANASQDGTLTVMYIENNNLFNVNMKTGKINATDRTGDVVLYKADESGQIPIGEYGWHRFAVRIHQDAVNNEGTVQYTVIATAYLDGVKILEVDKTTYALSKHNGSTGYTGLLYTASIVNDEVVCADLGSDKHCDAYVMVECIYANKNDANPGYVVVGDVSMTCGADFVQDVEAVADPAAATFEAAEGVELPAAFYYKFAD